MKRRMVYPDVLRALGCVAVVFLSVAISANSVGMSGLLTWAAPLFVMLSGMFFLDSSWYIDPRDMSRRYWLRLLIAYLVWAIVGAVVNQVTGGVLSGLLTGDNCYLNFLLIMLVLYLFSPVLRVFTRAAQPHELRYIVLFGFVIGCIFPYVNLLLGSSRMIDHAMMGFGYIGIYVAGWYLRSAMLTRKQLRIFYLVGGLCLLLTLRGLWMNATAFTTDPAIMVLSPDAVLIAAAIFLVVKNTLSQVRLSSKVLKPISMLSHLSFGIYLIHPILLAVVCYALNRAGVVLPVWAFIPLISIVLLVLSGSITYLLQKLPKIGRYVA